MNPDQLAKDQISQKNKLSISSNLSKNSRGVSVDSNKKTPKGLSQLSFNKLVAQTSKNVDIHTRNFTHNFVSEKVHSQSPQKKYPENNNLIPPQPTSKNGKKTLILDLDETLIHSGFQPFVCGTDIVLKIEIENNINNIYVVKRPGVDEFLARMGKIYEVVIFTASMSKYADPLMDILDKEKVCSFRLFRESCTLVNGFYVKELKRLNRNLKNVILLDNNPASYYLDIDNGLPIKSFYDDKSDNELIHMASVLENIAKVNDVREYIKQIVYNNQVNYELSREIFSRANEFSQSPAKENSRYSEYSSNTDKEINPHRISQTDRVAKSATLIGRKKEEANKNQLKILSVEIMKNGVNTEEVKTASNRHTPQLLNRSYQMNKGIKTNSDNCVGKNNKANNFLKDNSRKNLITPNYLSTNEIGNKEKKDNSVNISTTNRKMEIKRPSSVIPAKSNKISSVISATSSTNTNKPSSAGGNRINSLLNSSKVEKEFVRKNSSRSTSNVSINTSKNTILINKSVTIAPKKNTNNGFKGINDIQRSLELEVSEKLGNNTTRNCKRPIYKSNLTFSTNNNNKSLSPSPSKQREKDSNPKSARNFANFLNFRKDHGPTTKEKFNSIMTNKIDFRTNPLSESQHSTSNSTNKFKSSSFNSKSNGKVAVQPDLKIVKIVTNKSLSKAKHLNLKENNKSK